MIVIGFHRVLLGFLEFGEVVPGVVFVATRRQRQPIARVESWTTSVSARPTPDAAGATRRPTPVGFLAPAAAPAAKPDRRNPTGCRRPGSRSRRALPSFYLFIYLFNWILLVFTWFYLVLLGFT